MGPHDGTAHLLQKRQNLQRVLESLTPGRPAGSVSSKPLLLHLEITSCCNLRCPKCGHATDPPGTPRTTPRNLPYSVIETFDDYFASALLVHTFGYGEMFLYKNLKRLVERLKHHGCVVDGTTNGVLVDEEKVDWLVEYGYDELTFSIDGVKPETMRRLRGVDVEKLWRTLAYIKQRKLETGKKCPRVVVNFVAQSDNYEELPDLVRQLSDLDIYFLGVNPLMPAELDAPGGPRNDPYTKLYREVRLENAPREKVEAVLAETRRLAAEAKFPGFEIYIDLDALYAARYGTKMTKLLQIVPQEHLAQVQAEQKLQPYYCSYPWTSMYVHADSGARVCCYMHDSFGVIENGADFHKVWTEGPITAVRDAISKGEVHPLCVACITLGRYQHSHIELDGIRRRLETMCPEEERAEAGAE